ncbi:MAG: VWA domain-containing protein [Candidatus Thiodiazotropha sp. (ex Myrtea sp. 'scaly one' KF741663)]|nr:VWA domain-containing protein [Candidatus Thiodiazotropha sp. (ex Myrtea sp. 'scaly one' KF741663)]
MSSLYSLFRFVVAALLSAILAACGTAVDTGNAGPVEQSTGSSVVAKPKVELEELDSLAASERRAEAPMAAVMRHKQAFDMTAIRQPSAGVNRENYANIKDNGVKAVAEQPVSTFSIDVDSGAYALVRRFLNQGNLPPKDAVRAEELINYFSYDYPVPQAGKQPFSVSTEVARTPWNRNSLLVHVGIQGYVPQREVRPASNLVFLMDVSGSMNAPDKLPLLKSAFKLLVKQLDENDSVSLVVYAGASGVVLEPTPGDQQGKIMAALARLTAGGSTHGSAGIQLAYAMAEQAKVEGGINRVILATDGDFNVGTVNHEQLMDLIEEKREQGITLTTLGFGQGNYNDHLMEQLADKGNGNYAYIDTINEAQKVLVDELDATLEVIAKDVKIQIEWNPAVVTEYRLIGYENRLLAREDFNNDKVDAGDIGAGHTVTALYEIVLAGGKGQRLEPLRYTSGSKVSGKQNEIAHLRLRYKAPDGDRSKLIEAPILTRSIEENLAKASDDFRFSASVAAFAQLLRGGRYTESFGYSDVTSLAQGSRGNDPYGYRGEFLRLVNLASSLGG